jgi:hypothetical protein
MSSKSETHKLKKLRQIMRHIMDQQTTQISLSTKVYALVCVVLLCHDIVILWCLFHFLTLSEMTKLRRMDTFYTLKVDGTLRVESPLVRETSTIFPAPRVEETLSGKTSVENFQNRPTASTNGPLFTQTAWTT